MGVAAEGITSALLGLVPKLDGAAGEVAVVLENGLSAVGAPKALLVPEDAPNPVNIDLVVSAMTAGLNMPPVEVVVGLFAVGSPNPASMLKAFAPVPAHLAEDAKPPKAEMVPPLAELGGKVAPKLPCPKTPGALILMSAPGPNLLPSLWSPNRNSSGENFWYADWKHRLWKALC